MVGVTVENDKLYETEYLDFDIKCVDSPSGECPCPCNHMIDDECSCKDLIDPIRIGLTKTPVKLLYPLERPRVFNGRPYEVGFSEYFTVMIHFTYISFLWFNLGIYSDGIRQGNCSVRGQQFSF